MGAALFRELEIDDSGLEIEQPKCGCSQRQPVKIRLLECVSDAYEESRQQQFRR